MRRVFLTLLAGLLAVAAVAAVALGWEQRADTICDEKAPARASGYSVRWEWEKFAYVCDYQAADVKPRRVGIIDAFHGDDRRRHGR